MGRELRLGFAMGGGVSLGTFNGAALAEALKLALLFGGYYEDPDNPTSWKRYDRVVVDVFSGASAGAMSLGIMLRSLAARRPDQVQRATRTLLEQFPTAAAFCRDNDPQRWQDLTAAQVLQDSQEDIWCKEITLKAMLALTDGSPDDLVNQCSLLDRRAVDALARKHLAWPDGIDLSQRRLLGTRVLFACTLSNLSPLRADARSDLRSAEAGFVGLIEGLTSYVHAEVRVFDLTFATIPESKLSELGDHESHPSRWVRYHAGPRHAGSIGTLTTPSAWRTMAATSVASGAFPFAFEPVVLNRKWFEFGELWPRHFFDSSGKRIVDEYPFSYVDGGAFNNEPIREAFRLASFIDGQTVDPDGSPRTADFDRRIIFVDPNVDPSEPSFRAPFHNRFRTDEAASLDLLSGTRIKPAYSLDRLLGLLGPLVGAILNEARVVEADKIGSVRSKFDARDEVRDIISRLDVTAGDDAARSFSRLAELCTDKLDRIRRNAAIPATGVSLAGELRRVILEETRLAEDDTGMEHRGLARLAESHNGDAARAVEAFLALDPATQAQHPHARLWLRALLYVTLDISMGLTSKWRDAMLICIFPVEWQNGQPRAVIDLPGGRMQGFAGFTSEVNRMYEAKVARRCAREFLLSAGLIRSDAPEVEVLPFSGEVESLFEKEVEVGVGELGRRVEQFIRNNNVIDVLPGLDALLSRGIGKAARKAITKQRAGHPPSETFLIQIRVPDRRFELDGVGVRANDAPTVEDLGDDSWAIYTLATWTQSSGQWSGPHVHDKDGVVHLRVDRPGLIGNLGDSSFARIIMPSPAHVAAARNLPNPGFTLEVKAEDRNRTIAADRWKADPGVNPLDESIF